MHQVVAIAFICLIWIGASFMPSQSTREPWARSLSNGTWAAPPQLPSVLRRLSLLNTFSASRSALPTNSLANVRDMEYRRIISQKPEAEITRSLAAACDWYQIYLEWKVRQNWTLLATTLQGLDAQVDVAERMPMVLKFLNTIATHLQENDDVCLVDLMDKVCNEGLVRAGDEEDSGRKPLQQLVFAAVSWLTMLYEARIDPEDRKLLLSSDARDFSMQPRRAHYRSIASKSLDYEYTDHPLHIMLSGFGKIIPEARFDRGADVAPTPSEWIVSHFLCYHILQTVARIEIEWVDMLCLHLEFDSCRRVLKVFRFPSYCLLMYNHTTQTPIDRLIVDQHHIHSGQARAPTFPEDVVTVEYFRELLLTYRLIFGQEKSSHRLFSKQKSKIQNKWNTVPDGDPLLQTLCGSSCHESTAKSIYDGIGALETRPYYLPEDYPFFAKRLLLIQSCVKSQNPHNWRALWHDHRDISNWWQFWAVLFIGGNTIILSILTLAFQIYQVVAQQQHSSEGAGDHIDSQKQLGKRFRIAIYVVGMVIGSLIGILGIYRTRHIWVPKAKRMLASFRKQDERPISTRSIKWRCECGHLLHDTFIEDIPNAALHLQHELNAGVSAACKTRNMDFTDEESQGQETKHRSAVYTQFRNLCELIRLVPNARAGSNSEAKLSQELDSTSIGSDNIEPMYLLICMEGRNGSTRLLQLDVSHTQSDRLLFAKIRSEYRAIRGKWLAFLSLRCLREIRFVQFELWGSGEVDAQNHADERMLPPRSKTSEYCYEPGPPGILPPIGAEHLLHFFHTPNHRDSQYLNCWRRFPKKRQERLYVNSTGTVNGWGIHLVDGWNMILIWILVFAIVVLGSLAFGIAYSVLEGDIQSAFAVSSYVISFATLLVMGCSICSRWVARRYDKSK